MKVEKPSGPYIGPDIELAREAATVTIPWYGDDTPEELKRIAEGKIWNDHVAVQAAFTAIKHIRKHGLPELK